MQSGKRKTILRGGSHRGVKPGGEGVKPDSTHSGKLSPWNVVRARVLSKPSKVSRLAKHFNTQSSVYGKKSFANLVSKLRAKKNAEASSGTKNLGNLPGLGTTSTGYTNIRPIEYNKLTGKSKYEIPVPLNLNYSYVPLSQQSMRKASLYSRPIDASASANTLSIKPELPEYTAPILYRPNSKLYADLYGPLNPAPLGRRSSNTSTKGSIKKPLHHI